MPERAFDLVVIGSGPAGEKGAAQAAYFGKKVALIERTVPLLGGACTHTGTLPSKTLRESALALSGVSSRGLEEVAMNLPRPLAAKTFLHRERMIVDKENRRIQKNLDRHNIELFQGSAEFLDGNHVRVNNPRGDPNDPLVLSAPKFLIATGSRPHRPGWIPFAEEEVYDSDEILTIEHVPETMLVLGSGVIACEYACMFAAIGTEVTLLDVRPTLLGFLDGELIQQFALELDRLGLKTHLNDNPVACSVDPTTRLCEVRTEGGQVFHAAAVLAAAGRGGNSEGLNLAALGIVVDKRGNIPVNEHFQTSVPHIYAAGDIVGVPALASSSMEQGRVATCHACDIGFKQRVSPMIPTGIYTIPEISTVGATEDELKKKNVDYLVGRAMMRDNARGEILGEENGFLKLLFTPDKKLVGVHCLGPSATEIIHIGQIAMLQDAKIDLFIDAVFNYPTLSELYKYAAYDGLGALAKRKYSA
jgi:NAD(P) transhydrogenase